jgi:adenylate cyclase
MRMVRRIRRRLFVAIALANLLGVLVTVGCILWVLPGGNVEDPDAVIAINAAFIAVYLVVVTPFATLWGEGWLRAGRRWISEDRAPTDREVTAVLRAPMRLFVVHSTLWLAAAALFALLNAFLDLDLVARVAFTVAFAGLSTAAMIYLLAERLTRPLAKAALSIHTVDRPKLPGVTTRTVLGWGLGTGVPLTGLIVVGLFGLIDPADTTIAGLSITMITLAGVGLVFGSLVAWLGARAIAEPIVGLRRAIRQLGDGDLSARVEVSDGSVLGLLQSGFNDMAHGLEERARLQDLYRRQVGEDVALDALGRGTELGGRSCEVAVLFVDVVGSTQLASTKPAEEVVGLLNRFFGVVVDEVHANGGWINKFQGDATLAVFGAPAELADAAGRALATARALARRLPDEVPELRAGVGVAHGTAVAGNIGDERRFEFTVIGDPVNEAARLTELAKARDPMVLASSDAVEAAEPEERRRWILDGEVHLRGRARPTRLAAPAIPAAEGRRLQGDVTAS